MSDETKIASQLRLATIAQIPELPAYAWTTKATIRHWVHDAEPRRSSAGEVIPGNGLEAAILRIGRKVLIDLDRFDRWIAAHRSNADSTAVKWTASNQAGAKK